MSDNSQPLQDFVRVLPPKEMFTADEIPVVQKGAIQPGQLTTPIVHLHYPEEGGVHAYHEGDFYPHKSFPFREAVYAIDTIKRLLINTMKLLSSSPTRYLFIPFFLFPASWKKKVVNYALAQFTDYTVIVFDRWGRVLDYDDGNGHVYGLQGLVWKPQYFCDMVREVYRVGMEIAGDNQDYQQLVLTVCMILEFDDAYRYRLQDGLGEISMDALRKNPIQELVRILKVIQKRDGGGTVPKFEQAVKLLPFVVWSLGLKSIVIEFFNKVDLKKLTLDDIDWYRCLLWGGYDFRGVPIEERLSMRLMIDSAEQYRVNQERLKGQKK